MALHAMKRKIKDSTWVSVPLMIGTSTLIVLDVDDHSDKSVSIGGHEESRKAWVLSGTICSCVESAKLRKQWCYRKDLVRRGYVFTWIVLTFSYPKSLGHDRSQSVDRLDCLGGCRCKGPGTPTLRTCLQSVSVTENCFIGPASSLLVNLLGPQCREGRRISGR